MASQKFLVHAILQCTVCGWSTEAYLTAQRAAAHHVKRTGHKVKGELGYSVEYDREELD